MILNIVSICINFVMGRKVKEDFHNAIDDYIASCEADGIAPKKPFSGKLVLRMSSELHGRIAIAAAANGATINDFINKALMSALS